MRNAILFFSVLAAFSLKVQAQINPVQNLSLEQWYEHEENCFRLTWDEPELPHDEIIGYNIYQEDDLYMFLDTGETSIYNEFNSIYGLVSNCGGESFLFYNNGEGFSAHVTAVYEGGIESDYEQTIFVQGPSLNITNFENEKISVFPNPSKGIVNIANIDVDKVFVYDLSGKLIFETHGDSQIDLSAISKGIYVIKIFSEKKVMLRKIILE